jgi:mutator protein MutT
MKRERYQIIPAVFIVLLDHNERVLLHRRYRTGYLDGLYDFPSGHLEEGETLHQAAARELREETSLIIDPDELVLVHVNQNSSEREKPYINFVFLIKNWIGTPLINEPQKCDHIDFFHLDALPETTLQVQSVLRALKAQVAMSFSYFELGSIASFMN